MPRPYASGVVPASAEAVFDEVHDFERLADWHPAIAECKLTSGGSGLRVGAVRRLTLGDGGVVVERLVALDDTARSFTYEFVENPFGVRRYLATLRVSPVTATGEAFVEWWAEYDAEGGDEDRLTAFFAGGVYAGGIEALRERFAGTS